MKRFVLAWLFRAAVILGLVAVGGALTVVLGIVPIKASSGHFRLTRWFLHFAKQQSVKTHSMRIEPPFSLDDPRQIQIGAGHYEGGCRPCHGAPGQPAPVLPQFMTPKAPELSHAIEHYEPRHLFYLVRHGIKLTGMPAWPASDREDEVWAVVAFLRKMPAGGEARYRELVFGEDAPTDAPAVVKRSCARCHGGDGLGRGAFPRLAAQREEYLRSSLEVYARGERQSGIMRPLAASLSPAELDAAVRWYTARPAPPGRGAGSEEGRKLAEQGVPARKIPACIGCHGPRPEAIHRGYPRLAGQLPAYVEQQLELFRKGVRGGGKYVDLMREVVDDHMLTPEEVRAVAQHFGSLSTDP
ncbi:MAG: c-type cytochrome [Deltaproteobacteria bacterium]|nr:c-type cytochrome [Deltaproteobacteria bacterium]